MHALEIKSLRRAFVAPDGSRHDVIDVEHFSLATGQQMALHGTSGSGKTTFLNLIAGLLTPSSGTIHIDGEPMTGRSESQRDSLRGSVIGIVFQSFHLLPSLSALENVELGMTFGSGVDHSRARHLLERVGLADRMHHLPRQLSIGQQQRVAVARALANRPRLVLADEPTGSLDPQHAAATLELIRELCRESNAALLLVSHDRDVLAQFEQVQALSDINRAGRDAVAPQSKHATPTAATTTSRTTDPSDSANPPPRRIRVGGVSWGARERLARKSLRFHLLSTVVTVLATALASGLVMSIFSIADQAQRAFIEGPLVYDAVLGARGSPLQLVLNTVYHLESSPGNVPWRMYRDLADDPAVKLAVPYALGDNYRGYRVVGVTAEMFEKLRFRDGSGMTVRPGGRIFREANMEAVIGSVVAQRTGLNVGDHFHPSHGVDTGGHDHDEEYLITGVLAPTNSPMDRVIWIPIEGIFRMSGHVLRGGGEELHGHDHAGEIPDDAKEVSAVMIQLNDPVAGRRFDAIYNQYGKEATFVWPLAAVIGELFDRIGWFATVLHLVAYVVVAVSISSILAAIYNTISERRREFALYRALGARRGTVFSIVLMESITIATLGGFAGLAIYAGIVAVAGSILWTQVGVVLSVSAVHPAVWITPAAMMVLGAIAGVVPAWKAYRTDVVTHLHGGA